MALSKDDLVSGLREGLTGRSYIDKNTYTLVQFAEFIDMNVNNYGTEIRSLVKSVSKVGGNEMSVGEFAAWADYYLTTTIPALIKQEAQNAGAPFKLIRHKDTGAVYAWTLGDGTRPLFWHVTSNDQLFFLQSSRLAGPEVIDAETNLITFLRNEILLRFAVDKSGVEELVPVTPPPPPPTYTVVSGDTFSKIAAKLGVTVDALKAANPQVTNIDLINVGQVLNVPK
jgi:LysM repeat protein